MWVRKNTTRTRTTHDMVVQLPWDKLTLAEQHAYISCREMVWKKCSNHFESNGRRGILDFGSGDNKRRFFNHQIMAACKIVVNQVGNRNSPDWPSRFYDSKTSMLLLHDLGTGKTMTVVCMLGLLHNEVPRLKDFSVLIVCPLSVLSVWQETLKTWTTLGDAVAVIENQAQLTKEILDNKSIVVLSCDTLKTAYKTFMCRPDGFKDWADAQPILANGEPVARHPFFEHLETCKVTPASKHSNASTPAFCALVMDELHGYCTQTSLGGFVMSKVARQCSIKVGLTGTPCGGKPRQGADLCCALDVADETLRKPGSWANSSGWKINRRTVAQFHAQVVDRVSLDVIASMVPLAVVELHFDPFIGRRPDNTFDSSQIAVHDSYLLDMQKKVIAEQGKGKPIENAITTAFMTMVQCAFCPVLGSVGCSNYKLDGHDMHKRSLRQPSEAQRLLWRVIRDRQQKGHGRIVAFCESTTMLSIAQKACRMWKGCGKLFMFTSSLKTSTARAAIVKRFLSSDNPRSVLFISEAAGTGITLCPGSDTLIVFGDVPWNWASLHQVIGRVHRYSQDRPVEVIKIVPRRGIMQCKLEAELDKKDRLEKAICDQNYENYTEEQPEEWRHRCEVALSMSTLDEKGNYKPNGLMLAAASSWTKQCESNAAEGLPPPPYPDVCHIPAPVLADDIVLPPCSFPVEGFVESPLADNDSASSSSDDEPEIKPCKKRKIMSDAKLARAKTLIKNAEDKRSLVVADVSSSEDLSTSESDTDTDTESNSDSNSESGSDQQELAGFGDVLED